MWASKSKNLKLQVDSNHRGISMLFWVLSPKTLLDSHGKYWRKKVPYYFHDSLRGRANLTIMKHARAFHFPTSYTFIIVPLTSKYLVFSIFFTIVIQISVYPYGIMVLICISLMTNNIEHVFICLFSTHIFSCWSGCSDLLPVFWLDGLLSYSASYLYILDIKSFVGLLN